MREIKSYLVVLGLAAGLRILFGAALWLVADYKTDSSSVTHILHTLNNWMFTSDAMRYHAIALKILNIWREGGELASLPIFKEYWGYPVILAVQYWLISPHPLVGVAANTIYHLITGLLAFKLIRISGQERGMAICLAAVICLWPPSLSYSSSVLKDSLFVLSVFMVLYGLACIMKGGSHGIKTLGISGCSLLGGIYLFINIRPFLAYALVGACLAVVLVCLAVKLSQENKPRRLALLALLAICLVFAGNYAASQFSLAAIALPGVESTQQGAKPKPSPDKPATRPPVTSRPFFSIDALVNGVSNKDRALWEKRKKYFNACGLSLVPHASFQPIGIWQKALLGWRSFTNLLFRPLSWNRWPYKEDSLLIRFGISFWSLLCYLAWPGIAYGLFRRLKKRDSVAISIVCWSLALGGLYALVVVNQGTLYRHRDIVLLPLLLAFDYRPYLFLLRKIKLV